MQSTNPRASAAGTARPEAEMPDPEVGQILTQLFHNPRISNGVPPATVPSPAAIQLPPLEYQQSHDSPGPPGPVFAPPKLVPPYAAHHVSSTQNQSPAASQTPPQKRTRFRPTKSCERCREKKLKCDREVPCGACLKGRIGKDAALQCYYRDLPEADAARAAKRARSERQVDVSGVKPNQRVNGYEMTVLSTKDHVIAGSTQGSTLAPTTARNAGTLAILPDMPTELLGKIKMHGKKARYVGAADRLGLLENFEVSTCFLHGAFRDPEIRELMRELSAFDRTLHPKRKHHGQAEVPPEKNLLLSRMQLCLPPDEILKSLQRSYVLNWETASRVLHIPTFFSDCDAMFEKSDRTGRVHEYRLPQAVIAIAIAARLTNSSVPEPGWGRISPDRILEHIQLVQTWIDGLHGKDLLKFSTLQIRTLLLIARYTSKTPPLELWKDSGTLVRFGMAMGLHKEPETCSEMDSFMKEMRRKLWLTIVELDIHFSLAAGLPAGITSSNLYVPRPKHVDDGELHKEMALYPPDRPWNTWTSALPQIAMAASLKTRLEVANLLGGNVNLERDAPLILEHSRSLERELQSLPAVFQNSTPQGSANNKHVDRMFTSVMMDMSIRRPLLALYRTITLSHVDQHYPEARSGMLRCALAISSHLDALDPGVADPNIVKSTDYLDLFHLLCKNDIMTAALMLCLTIRGLTTHNTPPYDSAFTHSKHSLIRVVENTLNGLLQRLGKFGSDLKDIVPLSVVLQSGRSEGTEEERKALMITGAKRVLDACRKLRPDIEEAFRKGEIKDSRPHHHHHGHHCPEGRPSQQTTERIPAWEPPQSEYDPSPGSSEFDDLMNFDFSWVDWDSTQT